MRAAWCLAIGLALATAGCETFERGTTDSVYVISDPPGATVTVTYSDHTCVTPCRFDVDRTVDFTAFVAKAGFETASVQVKTHSVAPSDATSPDVTADYLGRVADYRNGADRVHSPNPVNVTLKKSAS